MDTTPELSALQARLLRMSRRRGTGPVVALISGISVGVSLIGTALSLVPGTPSTQTVVVSLIMAVVVPLLIAPVVSLNIVGLLGAITVAHDQMRALATTDPLTGIANRRQFFDEVADLRSAPPAGTVLLAGMVDVDRFKALNDRHGHAAGDAALVCLAERLTAAAGRFGVIGRLGGDEFGLFLSVPEDELGVVGDALHMACTGIEPQPRVVVHASLGLWPVGPSDDTDEAMRRADQALYAAKAADLAAVDPSPDTGASASRAGWAPGRLQV